MARASERAAIRHGYDLFVRDYLAEIAANCRAIRWTAPFSTCSWNWLQVN